MKRVAVVVIALAIVVTLAVRGESTTGYRFSAVFDTARGMVPGQLVKIAGTKVGTVEEVGLTDGQRARMDFSIDERFAPFRDDARCRILPEGLVSENYVECEPGTPGRPPLASPRDGALPTVALERTEVSVQLQQVIDTFSLPVSERIRVILSELGTATVGRDDDLNALLRRANPALGQAQEVLGVLRDQRREIRDAIGQTDRVLATVKRRGGDVRRLVTDVAAVTSTTAAKRADLERSVASLPPFFAAVEGALGDLDTAARELTPTARQLRKAAPALTELNRTLPAFSRPGTIALRTLSSASQEGLRALTPALPVVQRLATLAQDAARPAQLARELLVSLRDTGGVEGLMDFIYGFTHLTAAYDGVSHQVNFAAKVIPRCLLDATALGCDHRYNSPGRGRIPINDTTLAPDLPGEEGKRAITRAAGRSGTTGAKPAAPFSVEALPEATRRDLQTTLDRLLK